MPRKDLKPKERRELPQPDNKYNSQLLAIFVNKLFRCGKKSVGEQIIYKALDIIKEKTKEEPLTVLQRAIDNAKPLLEVKPRRVGGATYQVPVDVRKERQVSLALRWIIDYALAKQGKSMEERLAQEILDASHKTGAAIKKREDTHKMAEANKAFAHYRW